jgi:hypothetical protein
VNDDPDAYKILKLRAEILELGAAVRQLRQAGMHDAAPQLLLCRKRADLESLMSRTRGIRPVGDDRSASPKTRS